MGYKTCHVLNSSLDAAVCAKDCDRLKKQDFATKCRDKGGLYKCCIRRDTAFCHECRYLISMKRNKLAKLGRHACRGSLWLSKVWAHQSFILKKLIVATSKVIREDLT